MILVIGGAASGKRAYASSLGYAPEEMAGAVLDERPVLYDLQALVARDSANCETLLPALLKKRLVLCDEVGSGVIPCDKAQREAREQTGRLCIRLAQEAEKVVRMVSGIPVFIKGQP